MTVSLVVEYNPEQLHLVQPKQCYNLTSEDQHILQVSPSVDCWSGGTILIDTIMKPTPQNVENSPPTPYSRHKPLILKINADIWWEGMQPPTTGAHVDLCGHSCVGVTKCCDPCLKDGCP